MLSPNDKSELVILASELFPRDGERKVALVKDILADHYDPATCEREIKLHATEFDFLGIPELRSRLINAHADPDGRVRSLESEAVRRREQDRQEREAGAARKADTDAAFAALRRDNPALVEAALADLCSPGSYYAKAVAARGLDACREVKALVLDRIGKGATHAA